MALLTSLDVFLSFSRKDIGAAEQICQILEAKGLKCWMPHRDIASRGGYLRPVLAAADHCRALIAIVSSNISDGTLFIFDRVTGRGVPIILVMIDKPNSPPELIKYQESSIVIDASSPPLEVHLPSIAGQVNSLLNPSEPAAYRHTDERTAP